MATSYMGTSTAPKIPQTQRVGHRSVLAGRTTAERAASRAGISLRDSGITAKTRQRYHLALAALLPIIADIGHIADLDGVCEDWVEWKWSSGSTLGSVGDALCGLQFYWPEAKGSLRATWRLYKNWRRLEVPTRAPPMPVSIIRAFVSYMLQREQYAFAFLLALGFHTYLRTGEMLELQFRDLQLGKSTGIVTIRGGKSGLRNNMDEAIAIYDKGVLELGHIARIVSGHTSESQRIWSHSGTLFRKMFTSCVEHFKLQLELKPYSLRRGGATHDYMKKGVLEPILLRGRWHSLAVARLYLEDGLAQLPSIKLPPPSQHHLQQMASPFADLF